MRQRTAAILGGGAAVVLLGVLVGSQVFAPEGVCAAPAVMLQQSIEVDLVGQPAAVRDVVLCTARGCSTPSAAHASPAPTSDTDDSLVFSEQKLGPAKWRFVVQGVGPTPVTITAVDAADKALATKTVAATWTPVRSEPSACGASIQVAKPLRLVVPAS